MKLKYIKSKDKTKIIKDRLTNINQIFSVSHYTNNYNKTSMIITLIYFLTYILGFQSSQI